MVGSGPAMFIVRPGEKEGERILGVVETPERQGHGLREHGAALHRPGRAARERPPAAGQPAREPAAAALERPRQDVRGRAKARRRRDYHELEVFGDRIFAVTVESPDIQVSSDGGKTWQTSTPPQPADRHRRRPGRSRPLGRVDRAGHVRLHQRRPILAPPRHLVRRSAGLAGGGHAVQPGPQRQAPRERGRRQALEGSAATSAASRAKLQRSGRKDELFAAIVGGKIRKSTDGGKTWTTAATLR